MATNDNIKIKLARLPTADRFGKSDYLGPARTAFPAFGTFGKLPFQDTIRRMVWCEGSDVPALPTTDFNVSDVGRKQQVGSICHHTPSL